MAQFTVETHNVEAFKTRTKGGLWKDLEQQLPKLAKGKDLVFATGDHYGISRLIEVKWPGQFQCKYNIPDGKTSKEGKLRVTRLDTIAAYPKIFGSAQQKI